MRRSIRLELLALFAALITMAFALAPRAAAQGGTLTLTPGSYTTSSGGSGGQPVTNLHVQDQSGSQNNWNKYVEFTTPGSATYNGYRTYTVPSGTNVAAISAIEVRANFLGPAPVDQTWTWSIYNWTSTAWDNLGANSGASWSSWKAFSFPVVGSAANYVNSSNQQIRVRIRSNNSADNADLDYEAVVLTLGAASTATPTGVPSATPTATRTPTATATGAPTSTATSSPPTATPVATATPPSGGACSLYVATNGSDTNPGTLAAPWRTVQKAANSATAGSTVCVRAGTYAERVTINVSGSAGSPITFQNYPGEVAILDGGSFTVPAADTAMVMIDSRSYVTVRGFEIRNYRTSTKNRVPVGIRVLGTAHHIELRNNTIHHIENNGTAVNGTDAHGIAVHGTSGSQSVNNIIIDGNELHNLKLGSSEALVLNGNVELWQVTNNVVRDSNNIGIDAIGFEGTAPANDQARDGLIAGNHIYNIDTFGNPAYGNERSAGCIYVDGGTRIVIERNRAHHCNLGIEIASEHAGTSTSYVTVRNNLIYSNSEVGIAMGGYDAQRGSTENCAVVNNTLFANNTNQDWGSELYIQYDTRNNQIKNNIIVAGPAGRFIGSWSPVMQGNQVDRNLYFTAAASSTWEWKGTSYATFAAYKSASGNDASSLNGQSPLFVSTTTPDLHLQAGSPAINAGLNLSEAGAVDFDGQPRSQGSGTDIGADETP